MLDKKLKKPPHVYNWVRDIGPDQARTVKNLVKRATSIITRTYGAAEPILSDKVAFSLDRATAIKAAMTTGRANSRDIVTAYVTAFCDYDEVRRYSGKPTFDQTMEPFRIGKGINVPVRPLVNIVENGKLVPIFSVGWATFPLSNFQRRLLATVIEDAVFSLRDFKDSPGEFLAFPTEGKGKDAIREPLTWVRGDLGLLTSAELKDCLAMYVQALEEAKEILKDMPSPKKTPSNKRPSPDPDQGYLF